MLGFLFYAALVAGVGYYAKSKGRSPIIWALIAFIISPLISVIILFFLKNLNEGQNVLPPAAPPAPAIPEPVKPEPVAEKPQEPAKPEPVAEKPQEPAKPEPVAEKPQEPVKPEPVAEKPQEPAKPEPPVVPAVAAEAAAKCPYCDSEIPAGSKFCGNCGAKL